jgi:hypothetical protein
VNSQLLLSQLALGDAYIVVAVLFSGWVLSVGCNGYTAIVYICRLRAIHTAAVLVWQSAMHAAYFLVSVNQHAGDDAN